MDNFKVRNSPALRAFIQQNPQSAQQAVVEWNEFASSYPDLGSITSSEQWYTWLTSHPEVKDESLWIGKEVQVVWDDLSRESPQAQTTPVQASPAPNLGLGSALGKGLGGLGNAFIKASVLENEWDYQRVAYDLQREWRKEHGVEDFSSKEGADFLHGSLENPNGEGLDEKVRKKLAELATTNQKLAKTLTRHEEQKQKTYGNLNDDPNVSLTHSNIGSEYALRLALLEKENPNATTKEREALEAKLYEKISQKAWDKFTKNHPEKTQVYSGEKHAKNNKDILSAKQRMDEKEQEKDIQKGLVDLAQAINQVEREEQENETEQEQPSSQNQPSQPEEPPVQKPPPESPPPKPPSTPRMPGSQGIGGRMLNGLRSLGSRAGGAARSGAMAGRTLLMNPYVLAALGILLLILIGVAIIVMIINGAEETKPTPTPTSLKPFSIVKSVDKTTASLGDEITYTISTGTSATAGDRVLLTETIPEGTSFVSASKNPTIGKYSLEWIFMAVYDGNQERFIPPQTGPAPTFFTRSVQKVSVTEEQIKKEMVDMKSPYVDFAKTVYDAGVKYNVDPAFIMAIWRMESAYGTRGGYANNPGSIVYVRDGYLGMKKGDFGAGRNWGTWNTMEEGINAIAQLIATEYYPLGQTDTWSIHSGLPNTGEHGYHGRGDIGIGDIKTWKDYVNFYYNWTDTMDKIAGLNPTSVFQTVTMTVRVDKNDMWISNTGTGFAPNTGNTNSNQVLVRVGNALEKNKPGAPVEIPTMPTDTNEIKKQMRELFWITPTTEFTSNRTEMNETWAALTIAQAKAPQFFPLIKSAFPKKTIDIINTNSGTITNNAEGELNIGPNTRASAGTSLYQQIIIHELGHIIHGPSGAPRCPSYDTLLSSAQTNEGTLTSYSRENIDEGFSELVSYYVLRDIPEQPTSNAQLKWPEINPFATGKYPQHLALAEKIFNKAGCP